MRGSLRKLVFMAAVGGISSAAILAAIAYAGAEAFRRHEPQAEPLGGRAVPDLAVSVHQDASLCDYHGHRRDRGDHPPAARAPHGRCAARGAAGDRSARALAHLRRHNERRRSADAGEQHALLFDAERCRRLLCRRLCRVSVVCRVRLERGHHCRGWRDVPFPRQTPDRGAEPGGRAGAPAVRPPDRLPRRLQGGAAQRLAQRRPV